MTCVRRGNERLIHCKQGASPNRRDDDVEGSRCGASGESEGVCLTLPNGLSYMMADDLGFPRRKRGEHGRAGKSAPARLPKRADDPSRGVAQEALDVAHYITDMTAQLEAMAVAARLNLLAYFLGMAKAESELFVRTNAVAEHEAEESYAAESAISEPHARS